jgi:hypothetical protein
MPKNYKAKTDRRNRSTKPQSLPVKFKPGFLSTLDGRTDLAKALRSNYDAVLADVGGREEVGHVKNALLERFVYLEAILQTIEAEMVSGQTPAAEALGRWIQAVNSLTGLAKTLGIERKTRQMPWLAADPAPQPVIPQPIEQGVSA